MSFDAPFDTVNTEILICGDAHGKFAHILDATERLDPQAVVLLGDMEFKRAAHIELAPIRDRLLHPRKPRHRHRAGLGQPHEFGIGRSVYRRPRRCPSRRHATGRSRRGVQRKGLGATLAACPRKLRRLARVVAVGMAEARVDVSTRTPTPSVIHFSRCLRPATAERADILVTHEAPYPHPHGRIAINELADALGVRLVFHGHEHNNLNYRELGFRLSYEIHGVGLRGSPDATATSFGRANLTPHVPSFDPHNRSGPTMPR